MCFSVCKAEYSDVCICSCLTLAFFCVVLGALINNFGPYFVSLSLRDAEELFLTVWGSGGLCHHEGQNYKSVKRLWLCQIQRPQLCADGAGDKATQSRRKKCEYLKSKEQIK